MRPARAATTAGTVEGFERDGVLIFRGVPYAAPPVGALRFRPPQPVEPWSGVRDATKHGPVAPQPPSPTEALMGAPAPRWDEGCLALSVTTPALDGERPVLVWIHGGAFTAGAGSTPWYDGTRLALRGDVVVVAINYRLGAFGFTALGHLLGEEFADSGTLGIQDQQHALRWVRDNIAAFGGDPSRVTIFGESAGGMSVTSLVGSPRSAGLFAHAIAQSGAGHNVNERARAEEVTALLLQHAGLNERSADGLLALSAANIVSAQASLSMAMLRTGGGANVVDGLAFQPAIGGGVLPERPVEAIRRGVAPGVRLVTGTTTEEWKLFGLLARGTGPADHGALVARCRAALGGERGERIAATYAANRPGAGPDDLWSAIVTDAVFRIPAIRLAEAASTHQPETFVYELGHRSTAWGGALGACHAIDIPFVFDNLHKRGVDMFIGHIGDRERALAAEMSRAWLAFARGDAPWERYDVERRATRRFGGDAPGVHDDPAGDERRLWESVR